PVEPGGQGDPRGRRLSAVAGETRGGPEGPGRTGVRCARQAPVRGPATPGSPHRGHPVRRPARSARAPYAGDRTRRGPTAPAGTHRGPGAGARRDGLDPRGTGPRGNGTRRGAAPATPLHRVVLP